MRQYEVSILVQGAEPGLNFREYHRCEAEDPVRARRRVLIERWKTIRPTASWGIIILGVKEIPAEAVSPK